MTQSAPDRVAELLYIGRSETVRVFTDAACLLYVGFSHLKYSSAYCQKKENSL